MGLNSKCIIFLSSCGKKNDQHNMTVMVSTVRIEFFFFFVKKVILTYAHISDVHEQKSNEGEKKAVRNGIRTHAHFSGPDLKSGALDRSAILTTCK